MPDMFVMPFRPAYDSNGRFAPGAQAWFTLSETNTPYPVFVDELLSEEQPNPLVADGLGKFPRSYLDPSVEYRLRVYIEGAVVGVDDPLTDHDYDPYVPSDQGAVGPRGENALIIDPVVPTTTVGPAVPASASAAYIGLGTYQLSLSIPQGAPGASGALSNGDYGDIVVSGGGTGINIDAKAVTLPKMADLAANSIIGNNTGAGATPVALTVAQVNTMLGIGATALLGEATVAQYRAATADKVLTTDIVWSAADTVVLTPGPTVSVNMSNGFNFSLAMAGAYTLQNPTNTKNNQAGLIYIVQDATGGRTLAYGTAWKFEGGTPPVLTTTPNAVDVLQYQVRSSSYIVCSLAKNFG